MKLKIGLGLILLCMFGSVVMAEDYRLGPGDLLDVGVWGYQELQLKAITIRPDGKISFPLVGEVQAAGMSASELTNSLTTALGIYIVNPQVTVNIVKFRTVRVYVLGEVMRPGMYEIEKQHNLLDAVSIAGGHTKYARKKQVYLVHKSTGEYQQADYNRLLTKGDLTQNYPLEDGDVVYLASNHINFLAEILPYLSAAYQIKHWGD